ncbi:hypothetical protein ACHWQZ_G011343 [Mnemiopsis leidyi]
MSTLRRSSTTTSLSAFFDSRRSLSAVARSTLRRHTSRTSSSSVSTRSEKLGKKIRSTKGMIRSKSSVFRDEDSLSQGSLFSFDTVDKLVVVENFLNLERSYVDKLKLLVEKYEHALREHSKDSLTLRHNVNTVFHHPCHLLMIHQSFLIAAQHRVKKQASGSNVPILFGDLFLEMVNQFKVYIEFAKDFTFNMETLSTIESQYIQTKELIDKIAKEVEISLPDLFHIPLRQVETYQHLISNVRHQLLGGEPSSEAIILEEAEYKLEEVTSVIDRIMLEVRKRTRSTRKRELIHKGMMAGQNEKAILKMRYLFLYNDVLICARMPKTSDHASLYLPKWYLPLSDILLPLTHDPGKPMDTIQLKQLKVKIRELQRLLKEEDTNIIQEGNKGPVSKRMRGFKKQRVKALKDSLNEKIEEYHVLHMNLPFKIISKRGKTYTMHIHGEKERDDWMRQIQAQLNKVPACTANISLSIAEVESLLERYTKLRKNSAIAKLDVDNDDETVYDGVLLVQVICGTELGEVGTKPDIYCTLEADCNGEMCKKNKTKLMKGSINPIWDETICVPAEACQFLRIRAYGKKKFQAPSEIGSKLLTLADYSLEDNSPKPLAINLQPKGQIKLTIQLLSLEQARLRKESQHQTFGVPLEELALIEGQKIPPIIHSCFRQIERRGVMEEGIYRVNGIVGEIRRLKSAFDESARNGEILATEAEVNVVAGVVKQFFRELPKPLFPVEMYNDFVELLDSQDEADKEKMMLAFGDIPEPNISVIVRLIQHIKYIAEYQPRNKMDVNNLCLLFGPNVVKPPPCASTGQQTCESLTTTSMQQVNILKFFCEKPISRLQELHGDEESLRPGSAPPMLSPTSDRNVTPIVRHVSVASLATSEMIAEEDYNFDLEYSPLREDKRDQLANLGSLPDILNGNCISPSSDLSEFPDCSRQSFQTMLGDNSSIDRSISSETGRSVELPLTKLSIDSEAKKSDSSEISPLSSTQSGDSVLSPGVPSISLDSPSAPGLQGSDKTCPS